MRTTVGITQQIMDSFNNGEEDYRVGRREIVAVVNVEALIWAMISCDGARIAPGK